MSNLDEAIDFRPDIGAFEVEITFSPRGMDYAYPEDLSAVQAEALFLAAMRIIQIAGHDPWEILDAWTHEPVRHGANCEKKPHVGDGHVHSVDHDGPFTVDGVKYCGRCHRWIP